VVTAARLLFPTGRWLDKTPSTNMVFLAPRFRRIWPNARFVFMKRRAVENIASRMRKFDFDFAHNCREWATIMEAWLSVREQLAGAALELDQLDIARAPDQSTELLAGLLGLSATEQGRVAQMLRSERPQQTGAAIEDERGLEKMGWRPDWVSAFRELCGPMMAAYGYRE
jgi:hypothetical protein